LVNVQELSGADITARPALDRASKLYGGTPLYALTITCARANRTAEACKVIETLEAFRRDHYYPVEFIAAAYAGIGEMDRAFEWLNRVFETRSFLWSWLSRGWPNKGPLHSIDGPASDCIMIPLWNHKEISCPPSP